MEFKDLWNVERKVDDIIKEVIPGLSEEKRLELINRMSEYLHIDACMLISGEGPNCRFDKK